MKYHFFILFCFFNSFLYSQSKKNTDSVSYYNKLVNKNLENKKYNQAVFYTQKSINFCESNHKHEGLANQTFKLGKIYYKQHKYDEALKSFHKSVASFDSVKPTCTKVLALHYIGVANTAKGDYETAALYYKKAESLLNQLKMTDHAQVLNFQKAMALKANK
ncbi:MAG: tetratricopeptide repeat protein, partial [Flavobacterium sp.]